MGDPKLRESQIVLVRLPVYIFKKVSQTFCKGSVGGGGGFSSSEISHSTQFSYTGIQNTYECHIHARTILPTSHFSFSH